MPQLLYTRRITSALYSKPETLSPLEILTALPDLGADRTWIEEPEMVQARTEVAKKWFGHFGPLKRLSDLGVTHNTVG